MSLMNGIFEPGKLRTLREITTMRFITCLILSCSLILGLSAQDDTAYFNPRDVGSADAIVASLYDVISGPAGKKRNWDRMRSLFMPEAKLMATGFKPDGSAVKKVMSVEDYIIQSGPLLEKDGFFEKEIGRKTEQFGNIVHIFSTYESRRKAEEEKAFMRGINSIQLWNDGHRWWIVNVLWQSENPKMPIPEKYIQ